jgi:hypothetical protein
MCSFHLESPFDWSKGYRDIEIKTSSVNETHNNSTTPTSKNYF